MAVILVGGGARSGKSRYALDLARRYGPRLVFLATAEPLDSEMEARIARHRAERAPEFSTIEEPFKIADVIRDTKADAIVVDCLTLWLSNTMHAFGHKLDEEIEQLAGAITQTSSTVILVTNEVGCGIVPDNDISRDFRDRAGFLNQRVAAAADEVYWMVFGCALRVK
jgi:adenosylcobinamide kinase/adenosylcobinamide-phosphate guanylyltransferase